jgi:hypothetical protein
MVGIHDRHLDGPKFRLSYKVGEAALPSYSSKLKQGQQFRLCLQLGLTLSPCNGIGLILCSFTRAT